MKTILKAAVLLTGLTGIAGSAMADKTWNSDPSNYRPSRTQSYAAEVMPVPAESRYAIRKAPRLYRAPKAHAKSPATTAR